MCETPFQDHPVELFPLKLPEQQFKAAKMSSILKYHALLGSDKTINS